MGRRSGDEIKGELVAAVRRCLRATPANQLTVRQIADEAGLQHSLITRYFGSRDALIDTAYFEILVEWAVAVDAAEPDDALRVTLQHLFDHPHDLTGVVGARTQRAERGGRGKFPIADRLERHAREAFVGVEISRIDIAIAVATIVSWAMSERVYLTTAELNRPQLLPAARDRVVATLSDVVGQRLAEPHIRRPSTSTESPKSPAGPAVEVAHRRRRADVNRRRLMAATRRLLFTNPAHALTVRQIAAEASLRHSQITRYFGSKDELVRQVSAAVVADWITAVRDARPENALEAAFGYAADNPDVLRVYDAGRTGDDGSESMLLGAIAERTQLLTGEPIDAHPIGIGLAVIGGWIGGEERLILMSHLDPDRGDDVALARARVRRVLGHLQAAALRQIRLQPSDLIH